MRCAWFMMDVLCCLSLCRMMVRDLEILVSFCLMLGRLVRVAM